MQHATVLSAQARAALIAHWTEQAQIPPEAPLPPPAGADGFCARPPHYPNELLDPERAQASRVVVVPGVLTAADAAALVAARDALTAATVRREAMGGAGAWRTTYLSHRGRFSAGGGRFAAATLATLRALAERVDAEHGWALLVGPRAPPADEIRARCVELHEVTPPGALAAPRHRDAGSLVTVDVMLGVPGVDWEGGELCSLEADGALARAPLRALGDAAVFVSHKYHCVAPVTRGVRRVLVVEFWHGEERHCSHRCDTRYGPCAFDRHWQMMGERVAAGGDGAASAPREYAAAIAELDEAATQSPGFAPS